jgi:EAL domain-containing protein (putative c-di-GMP-specific phosphodiesterase class I)
MPPAPETPDQTASASLEKLGAEIAATLPGLAISSSSIHDASGDPVWMSGGVLGPDEYALMLDALDCFTLEPLRNCFERNISEERCRLVFPARDPRGALRGAVMVEAAARTVGGRPAERALHPIFASLLRRLSMQLVPSTTAKVETPSVEFAGRPLTLYVQQLLKLRSSGRTRRYEVLLRGAAEGSDPQRAPLDLLAAADAPDSGGKLDRFVLTELCRWLASNREQLEAEPATFSVNISTGALLNPRFAESAGQLIRDAHLNPRVVAFEIREQQCLAHPQEADSFIQECQKMGCPVVIDDFSFHTDALPLLRHRAVRMLKIDAVLTVAALKDKVAQAQVVAISQGSKVMGMHCVAKRIDSATARQWLAAIGVDFAQGFILEGPLPITDLATLTLGKVTRTASSKA